MSQSKFVCVRASYTYTNLKKDDILIKVGSRYGIMQMALLQCKKCFLTSIFLSCFQTKYLKILKSGRIF